MEGCEESVVKRSDFKTVKMYFNFVKKIFPVELHQNLAKTHYPIRSKYYLRMVVDGLGGVGQGVDKALLKALSSCKCRTEKKCAC